MFKHQLITNINIFILLLQLSWLSFIVIYLHIMQYQLHIVSFPGIILDARNGIWSEGRSHIRGSCLRDESYLYHWRNFFYRAVLANMKVCVSTWNVLIKINVPMRWFNTENKYFFNSFRKSFKIVLF